MIISEGKIKSIYLIFSIVDAHEERLYPHLFFLDACEILKICQRVQVHEKH